MTRYLAPLCLLALAGCSAPQENGPMLPQAELVATAGTAHVYVLTDTDANNRCYIVQGAGVSCVPLAYATLYQENNDVSYR